VSAARIEPFRDAGVLINVEPTTNGGTCKAVGQTVLSPIPAKQLDEPTIFGLGVVFSEVDGADRLDDVSDAGRRGAVMRYCAEVTSFSRVSCRFAPVIRIPRGTM
jgi:hypothetical protein